METGAVHVTIDETSLAEDPNTPVGAPGTVEGRAAADAAEASDDPLPFVAVTVNV